MAVTNTVQGLNCVIDLLKNILDETKSNSDKTVQPRDVSSTSRTTANITSPTIETDGLNSLNSINKGIENKAKSYVSIIKTITSKDVISGIKQLALLNTMGILKAFNFAIEVLIDGVNKIDKIKVKTTDVKAFMTVIKGITDVVNSFTNVIFSLGKIILAAAGLGVFFIFAWPMILLGFSGITATMIGVLAIVKLMTIVQKILFGGTLSANGGVGKGIKSGMQVLLFRQMVDIFLSLSAIIFVAAAVGLFAQLALPQIAYGFVMISVVAIAVLGLVWLINNSVSKIMGMSKGASSIKGEYLTKDDKRGLIKMATAVGVVAMMVGILFAISGLIVISAMIGAIAVAFWPQILIGFGAIISVVAGILLLIWAIKKAVDWIMKDKNSAGNLLGGGNSWELLKTVGSVAILVITMLAISLLIAVAAGVGAIAIEHYGKIMIGMGAIFITLALMLGALKFLIMIANNIKNTELLKAVGVLFVITVVLFALTALIKQMADLSLYVSVAGGWGNVSLVFISIGVIAGLMLAAMWGIGTMCQNPMVLLAVAIGGAVLGGIAAIMLIFSKAIRNFVETAIIIGEANKNNAFEGIGKAAFKIGWAISAMSIALIPASLTASLIAPAIRPLNALMNVISKFVNILSKVGKDPNFITPVEVDEDGKIKSTGEKANVVQIAKNIANSFKVFIDILVPAFEDINMRGVRRMGRAAKKLNKILEPVSKFADIISKVGSDPNFISIIDVNTLDENGNAKIQKRVKVVEISENISKAFSTFVTTLAADLENIEKSNIKKFKKLAKGEGVIGMISGFLDIFSRFKVSDDGKTLYTVDESGKETSTTINSTGIAQMLQDLNSAFKSIDYDNIEDFESWAGSDISTSSVWHILNNVEYYNKGNRPALLENATNVKIFQEEWTKLDNVMFKDSKNKLKALKEYKETMQELCKVLKEMSESTEKISQMRLPDVNYSENNINTQQKPAAIQQNVSTAVDSQNNISTNNQSSQSFNPSEIADAIKEGLSGSTIRFAFNDSMEEFIGEMAMS